MGSDEDERIMGEVLRDLAAAIDAQDFALTRRLIDAAPARIQARMLSEAKRLT